MKKLFYSLFLLLISGYIFGQIKEVPLENNPVIEYNIRNHKNSIQTKTTNDTVSLPFIEDFAQFDIYPESKLWLDSQVFINNTFPDTPIFRGVATFDCLDQNGHIHENANSYTFISDTLTSKPIDLNYNVSDSVYFSFFYQPQGKAYDPPEFRDSLVLEFRSPLKPTWHSVWHMGGGYNHPFKQVMIPILDTNYLVKGFQFRFKNYASMSSDNRSSNGDFWNLDLIRIDTARTYDDTLISDVGFVYAPKTYLRDYVSVPLLHFETFMDKKENSFSYRNYGPTGIGFDTKLISQVIRDDGTIYPDPVDLIGSIDLYPLDFKEQTFTYTASLFQHFFNTDSIVYVLKSVIYGNPIVGEELSWNDTAYFFQRFYNYYAYDDGFPESGIGIDGIDSEGSEISVKFYTIKGDTLRSVRFWFNRTNSNANKDLAFDLLIRENNNGMPGDIIYEQDDLFTDYGSGIDNYKDYFLDTPIYLEDTFFVGFRQNHAEYMNLGFDKTYDNSQITFYNIGGSWLQSFHPGTMMIRLVFGAPFDVSVQNYNNDNLFTIYPNPANNYLNINIIDYNKNNKIEIYDIFGRIVKQVNVQNSKITIQISDLKKGVYFIKYNNYATKFIKL